MKKAETPPDLDELKPSYEREELGVLTRGKYARAASEASNIVVLTPEVARAFPNAKAVNDALLSLIKIAEATAGPPEPRRKATVP
jgi:hypothetical protein